MDYDQNVCRILEDLDKCVFDCLNSSRGETEDNEDSLMDEAVLPCLLMSKDARNITDLDSQKNIDFKQNVDTKNETSINQALICQRLYSKEDVLNQNDEENLSSKQTEENFQYERSDRSEELRCKSERIDVLVILENDRRKVVNVKRYAKLKHLRKKFLKIMQKDALYTNKVNERTEIIFQTFHDKFKAWVDAEQDLVLTDGMNLKVIFARQKEKESKRSYSDANSDNHDDIKNYSNYKSKKLKSSVSQSEKTCSRLQSSSWLERSRSPPFRHLKAVQSYIYYERRDHEGERAEKAWHTSEYNCEPRRGNVRKLYMDDYNRGDKIYNGVHRVATTSYNNKSPAYNKLPHCSYQQVSKTQNYSEELSNFLKMVERKKTEMNEPSAEKVDKEELPKINSQNEERGGREEEEEEEEEGEVTCTTVVQSTVQNVPCEKEMQNILLSKKEIELYSARLKIREKNPVQAVQEICASVYKQAPSFEINEERCPLTKMMTYKCTLNVLGCIFTPERTQFNKKATKVDAANLFLQRVGFK